MLKYLNTAVTFSEFPDEISLCINITGCVIHCPQCHSQYLWEDIGEPLTIEALSKLIDKNEGITCVGLMGGDREPYQINALAKGIKGLYDIKVGWYSGKSELSKDIILDNFNYIKLGPYIEKVGGIDKKTTNQKMFEVIDNKLVDVTAKFWKHNC